jgi:hypothetical protein
MKKFLDARALQNSKLEKAFLKKFEIKKPHKSLSDVPKRMFSEDIVIEDCARSCFHFNHSGETVGRITIVESNTVYKFDVNDSKISLFEEGRQLITDLECGEILLFNTTIKPEKGICYLVESRTISKEGALLYHYNLYLTRGNTEYFKNGQENKS